MYVLQIKASTGQSLREYHISKKSFVVIGRDQSNDIILQDKRISKFHAALFCNENEQYFLQDLGSRNHTFVNSRKSDYYGPLNVGDEIGIEDYIIIFKETKKENSSGRNKIKLGSGNKGRNKKTQVSPHHSKTLEIDQLKDDSSSLLLLYKFHHVLGETLDLDEILQKIVQLIARSFDIDRIAIELFKNEDSHIPISVRYPDENIELQISKTIIRYLKSHSQAMIVHDATQDTRLTIEGKQAGSIVGQQIKSAIAIPLEIQGKVAGILYMDNNRQAGYFKQKDLLLFSVLGKDISSLLARCLNFEAAKPVKTSDLVGKSPNFIRMLERVNKIAETEDNILINGESGTGKELIANIIYKKSSRKARTLYTVNCAHFEESLVDSQLFGHNKGAFTGAMQEKIGLFEVADGATIFLDEIDKLSSRVQAKLLRVLQFGEFQRVGELHKTTKTDVRIIAAASKNLEEEIEKENFIGELFARFRFPIQIPPLRERKEDIPLLAGYFLFKYRERNKQIRIGRLSYQCIQFLMSYDWPLNIRELENKVISAITFAKNQTIEPNLFELRMQKKQIPKSLEEMEKEHIRSVLEYTNGNIENAMKILGVQKQTVYNKLKKYSLHEYVDKAREKKRSFLKRK